MASGTRRLGVLALIVAIGALMRLTLVGVNPPTNSYDDHLEPVAIYATSGERPPPEACWQCYQPPVYYSLSAGMLDAVYAATGNQRTAWEAVQWISALASIGTLILVLLLLRSHLPNDRLAQMGGLVVLVMLPRDLYTAASMGNDALLVFFVTAAVYCFARLRRDERDAMAVVGLGCSAVLAAWTKQSGLIALGLVAMALPWVWRARESRRSRAWILGGLVLVLLLAVGDEVWRTYQTGIPFASNQHFEPRAALEGQPPGQISATTFTSFLPVRLLEHPTLGPATVDSFWTQIFARTWYDYEPRFLPAGGTTTWLARSLYMAGLVATLVMLVGVVRVLRQGPDSVRRLLIIPLGFIAAAILQTVRFPYFSSMKSLFVLPSIGVLVLCFAHGIQTLRTKGSGRHMTVLLLVALATMGVVHWWCAVSMNPEALNTPTSPQWPFPGFWPPG